MMKKQTKARPKDVGLLLDLDFLNQLDNRAEKENVTRLSLIRKALAIYLSAARDRDAAYLAG
jgi:metal-responsive CopG/Arc/MetJ family transcriptional regulator